MKITNIFVRIFNYLMAGAQFLLYWPEPKVLKKYDDLITLLKSKDINKVLIVTDKNIDQYGLTKIIEDNLNNNKINFVKFVDVVPNPTFENIYDGLKTYKDNKCMAIICVGGGSVMDAAKAIGVLVNNKKPIEKYKGLFKVTHKLPLLIAFPTTCGTGSETTVAAVIRNSSTGAKFPIEDMKLVPKYAFLDENMLANLPPYVLATTAMDALTHAIEAYTNLDTTPKTRKYSLEAVKLIYSNIELAYNEKDNMKAKSNLLYASFLAGKAFTRSMVGNVHAIAHAIGGKYNLAHGYLNAIIMPEVLKEYINKSKKKLSELSIVANIGKKENDDLTNAKMFIESIEKLNNKFQLELKIEKLQEQDINSLAKTARKEAVPLYPTPLIFDIQKYEEIIKRFLK